jgi:hypothetical protein
MPAPPATVIPSTICGSAIRPLTRGSGGDVDAAAALGEAPPIKQQQPPPDPPSPAIVRSGVSDCKKHKKKEEYKNNHQNLHRRPPPTTVEKPIERCSSTSTSMIVRTSNEDAAVRRLDEIAIPSRHKETNAIIAWLLSLLPANAGSRSLPSERKRRMLLVEGLRGGTYHK